MSPIARNCAVCVSASASHFCANDDAFLCEACNASIHSSNVLARSHKVMTVQQWSQQNNVPSASQHSASNTTPLQPVVSAAPSLPYSEGQVVPCLSDPAPMDAFKAFGSDFELFDMDNGWLDKFATANGSGESWRKAFDSNDEAGLVPTLDPAFLDAPTSAAPAPLSLPSYGQVPDMDDFDIKMLSEEEDDFDLDMLVPTMQPASYLPAEEEGEEDDEPAKVPVMRSSKSSAATRHHAATFQMPAAIVRVTKEQATLNRAERVALYRAKRKNRKFEKTIRYASRKAYAEVRPRIKGRFAKPHEMEAMRLAAAAASAANEDDDLLVVPCF